MRRYFMASFSALLLLTLWAAGCSQKKTPEAAGASSTSGAPAPAATPAPAPAAAPPAAPVAAPPAATADAGQASAETTAKMAAAQWALRQDEIKNDADGQWASGATASSSYNDAQGDASWSAMQATLAPNVDHYGDDGHAWAPKTPDGGIEWLDLTYAKPVHASEIRIRESCGSGAVIKVELVDDQGTSHLIWQGNDPTTELNYLIIKFPPTSYKTNRVKITLATNVIPGWDEIDAVQLVGKG